MTGDAPPPRRPTSDWDGLVVVCGTMPWHGPRMVDQQLAWHLSAHAPVLYVEPPLPHWPGTGPDDDHQPEVLTDRLLRVQPRVNPGHQRPGGKAVALALTRRTLRRTVRVLGRPRVAAVIVPSLNPLFGCCGEQVRVFYSTDDLSAGADLLRISPWRLRRREDRQPADADLVVAASPELAARWSRRGHEVLLLPNGCDPGHFAGVDHLAVPAEADLAPPVAGVVGHLSGRLGLDLLHAVVDADVRLLLVGGRPDPHGPPGLDDLLARDGVTWTGFRSYERLPAYLGAIDVGLVPYPPTGFNRASFPLKMLEYLAAGRPVVSTDLPAARWLDTPHVTMVDDPVAFAAAVLGASAVARRPDLVADRRALAATHSWTSRVAELAQAIGLPSADRDPGGRPRTTSTARS